MSQAERYAEGLTRLLNKIELDHQEFFGVDPDRTFDVKVGRKYDRIVMRTSNQEIVFLFVDRNSWNIFGCKSYFQVNLRRWHGTLEQVDQVNWVTKEPLPGTELQNQVVDREKFIKKSYKPRGRPKKI